MTTSPVGTCLAWASIQAHPPSTNLLLTAFSSFIQGLPDAELGQECSPDQARTTQLKKDAKAALDGQDFTIIVATPYGNDLQWNARFDEYYRQDQEKFKLSQAMVLKDFDATSIEKGLIFSCNDFGTMTTLGLGGHRAEVVARED